MSTITVPKDQFKKVLDDVEVLIEDVATLMNQDEIAKKRLAEMKSSKRTSEAELDAYLKRRGI